MGKNCKECIAHGNKMSIKSNQLVNFKDIFLYMVWVETN